MGVIIIPVLTNDGSMEGAKQSTGSDVTAPISINDWLLNTFSCLPENHSLLVPTWTAFSDYNWTGLTLLNDFSFLVIFLSFLF